MDATTGSSTVSQAHSLYVEGWVGDPIDGSPMSNVKVYVDGTLFGTPTLNIARADVASYLNKPAYANSGFLLVASAASLSVGTHAVTVVAIVPVHALRPWGTHRHCHRLSTRQLEIWKSLWTPQRAVQRFHTAHSLYVAGWEAANPIDGSPLGNVKVYVDGKLLRHAHVEPGPPGCRQLFEQAELTPTPAFC